jgi:DNA-binding transcriptional LysR family regulator
VRSAGPVKLRDDDGRRVDVGPTRTERPALALQLVSPVVSGDAATMKASSRASRPSLAVRAASHTEHIASLIHVVDHGSLSAAARALRVPKSTLSRHLAQLEDALRAPVVVRGQRELVLTDVGARLVSESRGPLSALDEAIGNAAAQVTTGNGFVRMTVPFDYGAVVSALVLELLKAHPEVDVDLRLTDGVTDLRRDRIDLAVRVGTIQDDSLIARPLGHIHGVLVASPAFVDAHKVLLSAPSPSCLAGIPCVAFTNPPFSNAWTLHAEGKQPVDVTVSGRFFATSLPAVRAAAVAGFGVARLPLYMARDEIAAGRLQVVLPGWATPARPVQLVYPRTRHPLPRVRTIIQFFLDRARERRFDG